MKKILSKARQLEKNKAKQIKRFGNVEVEEGMGAAYMPKAGTQGVPEREVTSKAVKKQLNRNRNRAQMKGDLETPHIRYTHSRDKSTDYIRPVKKKRIHKKKVKEEVMIEGSKPNNPKLWAAKKAAAKAKFDVYPSAYANGWAAKQYKAAGGTWRSESVEYPAGYESDMKRMGDKEKNTWWKTQDKAKVAADKKKKEMQKESKPGFYDKDGKKVNDLDSYLNKQKAKADARRKKVAAFAKAKGLSYQDRIKHVLKKEKETQQEGMMSDLKDKVKDKVKASPLNMNTLSRKRAQVKVDLQKRLKKTYKPTMENIIAFPMARRAAQLTPQQKKKANADYKQKARDEIKNKMKKESFGDKGISLQELGDPDKMNQLFRMGLAKKGELQLMQRMMKRGPDALKDPKLRQKMYDLLVDLTDLVTKDGQTFVKVRQNVQRNKKELQAVKELLYYGGQTILEVNTAYKLINIPEDMSGMSVGSGHKRSVDQGAGMTKKGVAAYRRRNPGSKLQTAVTTPPSKLKKGSKAAKRRKAFCSRSRSWTGERGKAARRRWNC